MKIFTKENLLSFRPCHDGLLFAKSCKFDFSKIYETCERGDWLIWLLKNSNNLTKSQATNIAIACAQNVLGIYEKKYPSDKRPRLAIKAALEYVKNPSEKNLRKCIIAATDADNAADHDADAATYVAYAACEAARATYASYPAAYAADVSYAAAAAGKLNQRKWQADKIRELIPNPFIKNLYETNFCPTK